MMIDCCARLCWSSNLARCLHTTAHLSAALCLPAVRFMLEVVAAVTEAVGADRVGLRLAPFNSFLDAVDSTPYDTNDYLIKELNKFGLAYLHLVRTVWLWSSLCLATAAAADPAAVSMPLLQVLYCVCNQMPWTLGKGVWQPCVANPSPPWRLGSSLCRIPSCDSACTSVCSACAGLWSDKVGPAAPSGGAACVWWAPGRGRPHHRLPGPLPEGVHSALHGGR
jgi:hypothetical protein